MSQSTFAQAVERAKNNAYTFIDDSTVSIPSSDGTIIITLGASQLVLDNSHDIAANSHAARMTTIGRRLMQSLIANAIDTTFDTIDSELTYTLHSLGNSAAYHTVRNFGVTTDDVFSRLIDE